MNFKASKLYQNKDPNKHNQSIIQKAFFREQFEKTLATNTNLFCNSRKYSTPLENEDFIECQNCFRDYCKICNEICHYNCRTENINLASFTVFEYASSCHCTHNLLETERKEFKINRLECFYSNFLHKHFEIDGSIYYKLIDGNKTICRFCYENHFDSEDKKVLIPDTQVIYKSCDCYHHSHDSFSCLNFMDLFHWYYKNNNKPFKIGYKFLISDLKQKLTKFLEENNQIFIPEYMEYEIIKFSIDLLIYNINLEYTYEDEADILFKLINKLEIKDIYFFNNAEKINIALTYIFHFYRRHLFCKMKIITPQDIDLLTFEQRKQIILENRYMIGKIHENCKMPESFLYDNELAIKTIFNNLLKLRNFSIRKFNKDVPFIPFFLKFFFQSYYLTDIETKSLLDILLSLKYKKNHDEYNINIRKFIDECLYVSQIYLFDLYRINISLKKEEKTQINEIIQLFHFSYNPKSFQDYFEKMFSEENIYLLKSSLDGNNSDQNKNSNYFFKILKNMCQGNYYYFNCFYFDFIKNIINDINNQKIKDNNTFAKNQKNKTNENTQKKSIINDFINLNNIELTSLKNNRARSQSVNKGKKSTADLAYYSNDKNYIYVFFKNMNIPFHENKFQQIEKFSNFMNTIIKEELNIPDVSQVEAPNQFIVYLLDNLENMYKEKKSDIELAKMDLDISRYTNIQQKIRTENIDISKYYEELKYILYNIFILEFYKNPEFSKYLIKWNLILFICFCNSRNAHFILDDLQFLDFLLDENESSTENSGKKSFLIRSLFNSIKNIKENNYTWHYLYIAYKFYIDKSENLLFLKNKISQRFINKVINFYVSVYDKAETKNTLHTKMNYSLIYYFLKITKNLLILNNLNSCQPYNLNVNKFETVEKLNIIANIVFKVKYDYEKIFNSITILENNNDIFNKKKSHCDLNDIIIEKPLKEKEEKQSNIQKETENITSDNDNTKKYNFAPKRIFLESIQHLMIDILGSFYATSDLNIYFKILNENFLNFKDFFRKKAEYLSKKKHLYDFIFDSEIIVLNFLFNFLNTKSYDYGEIDIVSDTEISKEELILFGLNNINSEITTSIDLKNEKLKSKYIISQMKIKILELIEYYITIFDKQTYQVKENRNIGLFLINNLSILLKNYKVKSDNKQILLELEEAFFRLLETFNKKSDIILFNIENLVESNKRISNYREMEENKKFQEYQEILSSIFKKLNVKYKEIDNYEKMETNFFGFDEHMISYFEQFFAYDSRKHSPYSKIIRKFILKKLEKSNFHHRNNKDNNAINLLINNDKHRKFSLFITKQKTHIRNTFINKHSDSAIKKKDNFLRMSDFNDNLSFELWREISKNCLSNNLKVIVDLIKYLMHNINLLVKIESEFENVNFNYIFNENFLKIINFINNLLYYSPNFQQILVEELEKSDIILLLKNVIKLSNYIIGISDFEKNDKLLCSSRIYYCLMDFFILLYEGNYTGNFEYNFYKNFDSNYKEENEKYEKNNEIQKREVKNDDKEIRNEINEMPVNYEKNLPVIQSLKLNKNNESSLMIIPEEDTMMNQSFSPIQQRNPLIMSVNENEINEGKKNKTLKNSVYSVSYTSVPVNNKLPKKLMQIPIKQNPTQRIQIQQIPSQQYQIKQIPIEHYPSHYNPSHHNPIEQNPSQHNTSHYNLSHHNPSHYNPSHFNTSNQNSSQKYEIKQIPIQQIPSQQYQIKQIPIQQSKSQQYQIKQIPIQQIPNQTKKLQLGLNNEIIRDDLNDSIDFKEYFNNLLEKTESIINNNNLDFKDLKSFIHTFSDEFSNLIDLKSQSLLENYDSDDDNQETINFEKKFEDFHKIFYLSYDFLKILYIKYGLKNDHFIKTSLNELLVEDTIKVLEKPLDLIIQSFKEFYEEQSSNIPHSENSDKLKSKFYSFLLENLENFIKSLSEKTIILNIEQNEFINIFKNQNIINKILFVLNNLKKLYSIPNEFINEYKIEENNLNINEVFNINEDFWEKERDNMSLINKEEDEISKIKINKTNSKPFFPMKEDNVINTPITNNISTGVCMSHSLIQNYQPKLKQNAEISTKNFYDVTKSNLEENEIISLQNVEQSSKFPQNIKMEIPINPLSQGKFILSPLENIPEEQEINKNNITANSAIDKNDILEDQYYDYIDKISIIENPNSFSIQNKNHFENNFYYQNFIQLKKIINLINAEKHENFSHGSYRLILQYLYITRFLKEFSELDQEDLDSEINSEVEFAKLKQEIIEKCFLDYFDLNWIISKNIKNQEYSHIIRYELLKLLNSYLEENQIDGNSKFYNKIIETFVNHRPIFEEIKKCFDEAILDVFLKTQKKELNPRKINYKTLIYTYVRDENDLYKTEHFELAELYYKLLRLLEPLYLSLKEEFSEYDFEIKKNPYSKGILRAIYRIFIKEKENEDMVKNYLDANNKNQSNKNNVKYNYNLDIFYYQFLSVIGREIEVKYLENDDMNKSSMDYSRQTKIYFFRSPRTFWFNKLMKINFHEKAPRTSLGAKLDYFTKKIDKFLLNINVSYKKRPQNSPLMVRLYIDPDFLNINLINFIFSLVINILLLIYFYEDSGISLKEDLNSQMFLYKKSFIFSNNKTYIFYTIIGFAVLQSILLGLWYYNRFYIYLALSCYKRIHKGNFLLKDLDDQKKFSQDYFIIYDKIVTKYNNYDVDYLKSKKNDQNSFFSMLYLFMRTLFWNKEIFYLMLCFLCNVTYLISNYELLLVIQIFSIVNLYSLFKYFYEAMINKYQQFIALLIFIYVVEYVFSWISFLHFQELMVNEYVDRSGDLNDHEPIKELICSTAIECFLNHIDLGLRMGGGMGDISPRVSFKYSQKGAYFVKLIWDNLFHIIVNLILGNIFFGVIVDTFNELRDQKDQKNRDEMNKCYICNRDRFENTFDDDFDFHRNVKHKIFNYLYFIPYLFNKNPQEFTRAEQYVWRQINMRTLYWFPADDGKIDEENE